MSKVDLTLISGLTASDGSSINSGAILKFDSEFLSWTLNIRITPKLYRNRTLFEQGFSNTLLSEHTIPNDFIITLSENVYYQLTPLQLYEIVRAHINNLLGGNFFEIIIEN